MLSNIIKTEKDIYCMFSLISRILKNPKQMNKYNKTETYRYREQTSGYTEEREGRGAR